MPNAFERRQAARKKRSQLRYIELKNVKLHQLTLAERYYISAFTSLNGQPPKVLPTGGAMVLLSSADQLFATAHAIELGGEDE